MHATPSCTEARMLARCWIAPCGSSAWTHRAPYSGGFRGPSTQAWRRAWRASAICSVTARHRLRLRFGRRSRPGVSLLEELASNLRPTRCLSESTPMMQLPHYLPDRAITRSRSGRLVIMTCCPVRCDRLELSLCQDSGRHPSCGTKITNTQRLRAAPQQNLAFSPDSQGHK